MVLMLEKCILFMLLLTTTNTVKIFSDFSWTVYNDNKCKSISIPAKVPGGIYSDLYSAGVIDDIMYRFNDVEYRWVANEIWTYEGTFTVEAKELQYEVVNLVLHGVDTVAFVEINGNPVASTDNMFVRYVFNVKPYISEGTNSVKVMFESPIKAASSRSDKHFTAPECVPQVYKGECHVNQLRKMQASFGWDWGPAFPSVGLWKPVTLELYDAAIIRSVTTHIEKFNQHWFLKIKTYLEVNHERAQISSNMFKGLSTAELTVEGHQKISISKMIEVPVFEDGTAEFELNLTLSENVVRMWWPNGYGDQPLYNLLVTVASDGEVDTKSVQVGFRTIELVEEDAFKILGNTTGGKGLTFYFRINGYPLFMKGSNWIPASILPELGYDNETVSSILEAVVDSNMNMLRVWGGGVYESDFFYQQCDELGILIWQDFLFACSMYPTDTEFLESVKKEIDQNVKRLQHHPSIALWAGNNENEVALRGNWYSTQSQFDRYKAEYIKLYVDTIKPIVNQLDPGRRYLVSSPSNGLQSEKDGYIAENPYDSHYGDTHYYNYIADLWDMNIYPPTRFASEYGFQSLPSVLTMKTATNVSADFSLNSEYSKHRQHSPNGNDIIETQIRKHLKLNECTSKYLSDDDSLSCFEKIVFYSQIVQAMAIKAETEYYRQSQADWYTMGALYWQLNDVWQAPTWSGFDFLHRWKMLQYFAANFFAPVLVSPRLLSSGDVVTYVINDRFVPIVDGKIKVEVYNWSSMTPVSTKKFSAQVEPLSAAKQNIPTQFWNDYDLNQVFLKFTLTADGVESTPPNFVFPKPLKFIKGLTDPNIRINVTRAESSPDLYKYWIDINVDAIVLFLWLESPGNLHSYFEENGLIITTPHFRTSYTSSKDLDPKQLKSIITYQYYYEV